MWTSPQLGAHITTSVCSWSDHCKVFIDTGMRFIRNYLNQDSAIIYKAVPITLFKLFILIAAILVCPWWSCNLEMRPVWPVIIDKLPLLITGSYTLRLATRDAASTIINPYKVTTDVVCMQKTEELSLLVGALVGAYRSLQCFLKRF